MITTSTTPAPTSQPIGPRPRAGVGGRVEVSELQDLPSQ
jgi:hypothetical protein